MFMDEVIVTAKKREPKTEYEKLLFTRSIREEEIRQSGALDVGMLLQQKIPGLWVGPNEKGVRYVMKRGTPVTFILNGVIIYNFENTENFENFERIDSPHDIVLSMNKDDIAQIDLVRLHAFATLGQVIAITTKGGDGKYNAQWHPTNLKTTMPLGFQLPVEFYAPKYELAIDKEKKELDLRTTIHWQPRTYQHHTTSQFGTSRQIILTLNILKIHVFRTKSIIPFAVTSNLYANIFQ